MTSRDQIIIIGGGLSGLALAYFLKKNGIDTTILEASARFGGRIHTVKGALDTPLELGATWFSDVHVNLLELIEELGLTKYPQYSGGLSLFQTKSFEPPQTFFVPAADNPSYRIAGGTQMLIDILVQRLDNRHIYLNKKVKGIRQRESGLTVEVDDGELLNTDKVVVCIPPQLASANIQFEPALPELIMKILPTVQTWMAGSIKFTLEYSEPFWRQEGYSGMLYSHAGIVMEMYDHTSFKEDQYGFTGFLNSAAAAYDRDVRKEFVLRQLSELFGPKAAHPNTYFDKIWVDEFVIKGRPAILRPHQNNGHPVFSSAYMQGRLHFCGTETATEFETK